MVSNLTAADYAHLIKVIGGPPARFAFHEGRKRWLELQRLDPSSPFLRSPPGAPPGAVGLEACRVLAGREYGIYPSRVVGESIATWVIPLFILLGNINFTSFSQFSGWSELSIIAIVLGNPIEALWSFVTKVDVARRIRERCQNVFTQDASDDSWVFRVILIALDDFSFSTNFELRLETLRRVAFSNDEAAIQACRQAAIDLAINRVKNIRRTTLALVGYCTAVFAKFWMVNPQTMVPHLPHTIAFRVLYYFLGPIVVMSVIVGGYPSELTSVRILRNLQEQVPRLDFELQPLMPWNGGNYAWRPRKDVSFISRGQDKRSWKLALLSIACILAAWGPSFVISFFTPTIGLGPRGLIELCACSWWLVWGFSSWFSWYWGDQLHPDLEKRWVIMSCLNGISACIPLAFVLVSLRGFWNSCWGWSAILNHGNTNAYIHFNMMDEIAASLYAKYLPIVIAGMALQLALTLALLGLSQGKAGSDFAMEDQALNLYRKLLHQPELKPGARRRIQQVFIKSYYFLLRWRLRGDRDKGVE